MQNDPKGSDRLASVAAGAPPEITDHIGPPAGLKEPTAVAKLGGPKGPEPTRFGDWEKNGRCIDF
ncbi:MAG: DUF1674 domain-containing protein [Gammaproteobacteria bacterium]|nr:DUF1674 domain-containing protein [Gammaproteobacteria bacterium]